MPTPPAAARSTSKPPGTYTLSLNGANDDNTTGDLDILKSVNILNQSGGTVVIDAGGLTTNDRVFDIAPTGPGVNVTITGVVIERGNPTGPGGGIRSLNSNLVLINDQVFNNAAGTNGGGLAQTGGGDLTITNCLIDLNRAGVGGGGAFITDTQNVTITNSQFFANASSGDGGGLLCLNASTSLFIASSTFITNTASSTPGQPSNGGGLELRTNNTTLTDVTVSGNHASIGGGIGCATVAGGIILRNDTVAFNTADDTRGGGIFCDSAQAGAVRLINTIVAKNILGTGATHPDVDNNDQHHRPGGRRQQLHRQQRRRRHLRRRHAQRPGQLRRHHRHAAGPAAAAARRQRRHRHPARRQPRADPREPAE